MAAIRCDIVSDYDLLTDRLAASFSHSDHADHMARMCLDRLLAVVALERMGALPASSVAEITDPSPEVDGVIKQAMVDGIRQLFDGRDTVRTACQLLDSSSSFMYGDRARDAGVHYTPLPIASYICRRTIDAHIGQRLGHSSSTINVNELDLCELHSLYFDLLKKIGVLDSSCGSGIFLEAALDVLYDLRAKVLDAYRAKFSTDKGSLTDDFKAVLESDDLEFRLKMEILSDNIHGVDIEPYSIEVASIRLKLLLAASATKPMDLKDFHFNLICKNVLLAPQVTLEGIPFGNFDVVVGNPPYMRVKSMFSGDKDAVSKKKEFSVAIQKSGLYRYQEGNLNLYKLFIERNLSLLKNGGSMGLIFPASFLNETTSEQLRKHIFKACTVKEIVELPERSRLFSGVNQATAILVLDKIAPHGTRFTLHHGSSMADINDDEVAIEITVSELEALTDGRMEVPLLSHPGIEWDMIKTLKRFPMFKGNDHVSPIGSITVGNLDETFDKEYISEVSTGDILVKGIHLKEYAVDLLPEGAQPRWVKKGPFINKRPSSKAIISQPRIIGRNTLNKACSRRLKFALLPQGYICCNSIKQILITDERIDPLYLLALLNSSTLNWYFELFNDQNNIRNYSVEALPIVRAPASTQSIFARVVRLLMGASGDDREYLDKRIIDPLAYELYFREDHKLHDGVRACIENNPIKIFSDATISKYRDEIEQNDQYRLIMKASYKTK